MWESLEQYLEVVQPTTKLNHRSLFGLYTRHSVLERVMEATRRYDEFADLTAQLAAAYEAADVRKIRILFRDLIIAAEQLFLFSEALARLEAAEALTPDFDLLNHLDRYAAQGDRRVLHEIEQVLSRAQLFVVAALQHVEEVAAFATEGVQDLPKEVRGHFQMARHLISIEAYEMGMLSALRGLEGTLRLILHRNRVTHEHVRQDATLGDLINAALRFRWARGGEAVLPPRTGHLLQFLRVARNAAAHAGPGGADDWRATTGLALTHSLRLWATAQQGRRRIAQLADRQRRAQ